MLQADLENPGRRTFLKTSGMAAAAGLMSAASAKRFLAQRSNPHCGDRPTWSRLGPRERLSVHSRCRDCLLLRYRRKRRVATAFGGRGKMGLSKPQTYVDVRKLLEDKNVDAVSIATPNHWHSLMGIWAAQAGKDIYIEKPCSHNWWEGRQLVKAVEKYKVICEHGSQCRSSAAIREAMEK